MEEKEVTDVCRRVIEVIEPDTYRPELWKTLEKSLAFKRAFLYWCIVGFRDEVSARVRELYLTGKFGNYEYEPIPLPRFVSYLDKLIPYQNDFQQNPAAESFVVLASQAWE